MNVTAYPQERLSQAREDSLKGEVAYRIREVDAQDEDVADILDDLHCATFYDSAPMPSFDEGHWWIAYHGGRPVGFAGLVQSTLAADAGYLSRVGVLSSHCGRSLQFRLLRAAERRARRNGWRCVVSDTTDNLRSANNFIRAGYGLYRPKRPWGWPNTLYWYRPVWPAGADLRRAPGPPSWRTFNPSSLR